MDYTKTGHLIKSARLGLGMTQKELAEQLHISDRTVSKWERGAGFPDVSLLEPLSKELGLEISELVMGERREIERNDLGDSEIMRQALLILKREVLVQLKKKMAITSLVIILPFLLSILIWPLIPNEIPRRIAQDGSYINFTPKAIVFIGIPIVLVIGNILHISRIEGKIDYRGGFRPPIIEYPSIGVLGKSYNIFKRLYYWVFPIASFITAIVTYIAVFKS